jgi:hypothetical protein
VRCAYAAPTALPAFGLQLSRASPCGRPEVCDDVGDPGPQGACGIPRPPGQLTRVPASSISIMGAHGWTAVKAQS